MNPIIDNRIVNDITFATRLNWFLDNIPAEWRLSQPYYNEEYSYLRYVAKKLLNYQLKTISSKDELAYFKNL